MKPQILHYSLRRTSRNNAFSPEVILSNHEASFTAALSPFQSEKKPTEETF